MLLLGAAGLPYLLSSSSGLPEMLSSFGSPLAVEAPSEEQQTAPDPDTLLTNEPQHAPQSAAPAANDAPAEERRPAQTHDGIVPLEEALRFDVSSGWVLGRWQRVSTALADLELQGYRVALVSGTREDDVAGALTYYFNRQQRVERIEFEGTTGDARRLVGFLASQHQFVRQMHPDAGLYLYQVHERGAVISQLRITPSTVVRGSDPHRRFHVMLLMQRPSSME